jgi:hypothetical protein
MRITAEFQSSISIIIPVVVDLLKHPDTKVCQAGAYTLSQLSKQGKMAKLLDVALLIAIAEFQPLIGAAIPKILDLFNVSDRTYLWAAATVLSVLSEYGKTTSLSSSLTHGHHKLNFSP